MAGLYPRRRRITRIHKMKLEDKKELAKTIAASNIIPAELRGKPADVFVLLDLAESLNEPYWKVINGIRVAQGRLMVTAEFQIGRALSSGVFLGTFEYERKKEKENLGIRVKAISAQTGEPVVGPWVDLKMAKADGWTRNKKYQNPEMAEHMLRLRAATFFIRLHCPQTTFGGMTAEEGEDVAAAQAVSYSATSSSGVAMIEAKAQNLESNNETV